MSQQQIPMSELSESEYTQVIKNFLYKLLDKRSGMKKEEIAKYLDIDRNMKKFVKSFTHRSFDPVNNYEYFETLGDATLNKCVVWYFHRRFPEIKDTENPSYVLTTLKIHNVSKEIFTELSLELGLDKYIRYRDIPDPKKLYKKVVLDQKLISDVFEAVMGCLEDVIDDTEKIPCVGVAPVYNILYTAMSRVKNISLNVESMVDSKSQITQIFQKRKAINKSETFTLESNVVQQKRGDEETGEKLYEVILKMTITDPSTGRLIDITIPPTYGKKKKDAEQRASKIALTKLKDYGITFA